MIEEHLEMYFVLRYKVKHSGIRKTLGIKRFNYFLVDAMNANIHI